MMKVICKIGTLNEFGDYEFEDSFFPNNESPANFFESNHGRLNKQVVVPDHGVSYVLYTHETLNEEQKAKLEQDWKNFCS
ncbi:hypothetical protein [Acinetobacter baumannii]|uniref:hypothetical protein n=1 Tax=Acinetobacter baumannii TaxID=470 RepID=UPI003892569A